VAQTDKKKYFYGTGRRKTAVARVRLISGTGEIIVNGTPYEKLFPYPEHRRIILKPLLVTENLGKYNAVVKVEGGGISGQGGAISHGIARALVTADYLSSYNPVVATPRWRNGRRATFRA
jgi:small subunit ribosomal protein S9